MTSVCLDCLKNNEIFIPKDLQHLSLQKSICSCCGEEKEVIEVINVDESKKE
jgi:hypothetical protein